MKNPKYLFHMMLMEGDKFMKGVRKTLSRLSMSYFIMQKTKPHLKF